MSLLLAVLLTAAPQKSASISDRAVDYVGMRSGPPLFGVVLKNDGKQATLMAVQRAWMKKEHPEDYARRRTLEIKEQEEVRKKLIGRIKAWMRERSEDEDLMSYLEKQLQVQQEKAQAKVAEPQFMLVKIKPGSVRRTRLAKKENRAVLFVALRERLENIETRSAKSIREELKRKQIQIPTSAIDLSSRVPASAENDNQWAARQAIIEQLYRDPVKMRGTPQMVIRERVGEQQQVNVEGLAAKMMQQQMSKMMEDLLAEPNMKRRDTSQDWLPATIKAAKENDSRAAHVLLVIPDATLKAAVVESRLVGRMPDGKWRLIWSDRQSVRPKADPEAEKELMENEQLGGILNALGGAGQNDAVTKAIRFGLATREAQRLAESAYVKWRDPFYDDLSKPMILLPRANAAPPAGLPNGPQHTP